MFLNLGPRDYKNILYRVIHVNMQRLRDLILHVKTKNKFPQRWQCSVFFLSISAVQQNKTSDNYARVLPSYTGCVDTRVDQSTLWQCGQWRVETTMEQTQAVLKTSQSWYSPGPNIQCNRSRSTVNLVSLPQYAVSLRIGWSIQLLRRCLNCSGLVGVCRLNSFCSLRSCTVSILETVRTRYARLGTVRIPIVSREIRVRDDMVDNNFTREDRKFNVLHTRYQ